MERTIALVSIVVVAVALDACGSRDAPDDGGVGDAQFESDYRDDYESDTAEDQAEAAEEATLDLVDDLDDVSTVGTSATFHTASPPKGRRIHGALSIVMDNAYLMYADDATLTTRFQETRALGADVVRFFLSWRDTDLKEHDPPSPTRPSF